MSDVIIVALGGTLLFLLGVLAFLEFLGDFVSLVKAAVRKVTSDE